MRVDRQSAGIDKGFAPRQPQEQSIAEYGHDRRFWGLTGNVVEPDGTDKLAVHEHAETIAIAGFIKVIRKFLFDDGVKQTVCMKGLVTQPVDRFEILPAFTAPVFDAFQNVQDVAREQ
ncbi:MULTISPECIES: hypothetical protein [unclassified Mesorhizobium]|uniref:hypothetical protein n=1 Tax=unclassified Mesorhizobium TaxID=325217 RepID=UPI001FDEDD7E|nr:MULTISPECIES: hypothetical protein [unclassified Mesorhizobium]